MTLSFRQAADWLFGLQKFGVKLGLEKVTALLAELDNPHHGFLSVHIAGTNGKGTAAAAADSVLRAHGLRCGLYTSPHLVSMRERIRVDGEKVPEEFVAEWAARRRDYVERNRVTFFETVTALAFDWFGERRADVVVAEVGMGGRFDATNVLRPAVTAITSIGLEHTSYLGDTIEAIAGEKAGIIKPGAPVVCGETAGGALAVIRRRAEEESAPLLPFDDECDLRVNESGPGGSRFAYRSPNLELDDAGIPLVGEISVRNACLGLRCAELALAALGESVDPRAAARGLGNLSWPGRFQRVAAPCGGEVLLEVAHNPPAAALLARNLELIWPGRPATVIAALAGDKDYRAFLDSLLPAAGRFIFPRVDFGRADTQSGQADPDTLTAHVRAAADTRADTAASVAEALELARDDRPLVVTGSFHTVGAAMAALGIEP